MSETIATFASADWTGNSQQLSETESRRDRPETNVVRFINDTDAALDYNLQGTHGEDDAGSYLESLGTGQVGAGGVATITVTAPWETLTVSFTSLAATNPIPTTGEARVVRMG